MAFFSPKTWKQRIVEFPGRRRLDDTSTADVYDVSRAEGIVTQEGDGFTAVNMNDLEQRINNAVNDVAGLNAEEYDPKSTYKKGALRTNNNALWKAKENIDTPEQWTPEHWDSTTIAKELEENRDASKVTYNNESSGLASQTVQEAIDENAQNISALNSRMNVTDVQIEETITLSTNRVKKSGNVISGSAGFTKSTTGWVTIGTIAAAPFAQYDFPLIRNNDGLHIGILRISENGTISAYSADAAGDVSASFSYIGIMT